MIYYELSRKERENLVDEIEAGIKQDFKTGSTKTIETFGAHSDIYIRRMVSRVLGWLYRDRPDFREISIQVVPRLLHHENEKVRQTIVYTVAEIGIVEPDAAYQFLETALKDRHPTVKRGVVGVLKRLGEKYPEKSIKFSKKFLHHEDPEIRREIIHGMELHGRKHPEDVLPLLKELEYDTSPRVRRMIVHVLGQISYKKGCLEIVAESLKTWENRELIDRALNEILDVYDRYESFSAKSFDEALEYLKQQFPA